MLEYPLPSHVIAEVKLPHSLLLQRADGIVEIRCADDFTYETEHIMENQHYLKQFAGNGKVRVLNIIGKYTSITNEARTHIAKGGHKDFIAAEAFLIQSLPHRLLAQFFIKANKPVVPAKYFAYDQKEEAEKWLFQFSI